MPKTKIVKIKCGDERHQIEIRGHDIVLSNHNVDDIEYELTMMEFGEPALSSCLGILKSWNDIMKLPPNESFKRINARILSSALPKEMVDHVMTLNVLDSAKAIKPGKAKRQTVIVKPMKTPRLRARYLDTDNLAERCRRKAIEEGSFFVMVDDGGSVAKSYGYFAETECAVAISDPTGRVAIWCARTNAYSPSRTKCAYESLYGEPEVFIVPIAESFKSKETEESRQRFTTATKALHRKVFGPVPRKRKPASEPAQP